MVDMYLLRLQYSILNRPLAEIAAEIPVPLHILEIEVTRDNWIQWWPDSSSFLQVSSSPQPVTTDDINPIDESLDPPTLLTTLEEGAQIYTQEAKIRLQVFQMAKELYFSHKYASLEASLITKANIIIDNAVDVTNLKALSTIFKDMTANSLARGGSSSYQLGVDDSGMPTVIIRDLSGRPQ